MVNDSITATESDVFLSEHNISTDFKILKILNPNDSEMRSEKVTWG